MLTRTQQTAPAISSGFDVSVPLKVIVSRIPQLNIIQLEQISSRQYYSTREGVEPQERLVPKSVCRIPNSFRLSSLEALTAKIGTLSSQT